jgi:hypothetical protein
MPLPMELLSLKFMEKKIYSSYIVSIRMDMDNNGKIIRMTFNTESYSVLTYDYPENIIVYVRDVK